MRRRAAGMMLGVLAAISARVLAQYQAPAEHLFIEGAEASTWAEGGTNVIQLRGPVGIDMDRAQLRADNAVIWITPVRGAVLDQQRVEIALIGDAAVDQGRLTRTGETLFVTGSVRGPIRVTAGQRLARDLTGSDVYARARILRNTATPVPPAGPATRPTITRGVREPGVVEPVTFRAPGEAQTVQTPDGRVAIVLDGGVFLLQERRDGSLVELQAQKAVVFTSLTNLAEVQGPGGLRPAQDAVQAVYLEGDVRITQTPAGGQADQRLRADRVYYDFPTDRAVLTEAVIQATDPTLNVPILVRAGTARQLSLGEFDVEGVEVSTSRFATPTYSIAADRAYVRSIPADEDGSGGGTQFAARNTTLRAMGIPFFWLPAAGGTVPQNFPLRSVRAGSRSDFGLFGETEWGFFESIGRPAPDDLDVSYRIGYYGERGPAGGVDVDYAGGYITRPERDPWSFDGELTSYFVYDEGEDDLGGIRNDVEPEDTFRGRALYRHQHFMPGDWQAQVSAGWVSDPTFLEEWFEDDFREGVDHDLSLYLKRQRDTEAFTFLAEYRPWDFVTTSDQLQENFTVDRLPELGYYRIGDSPWDNRWTFFSENTVSVLRFNQSDTPLGEHGFPAGVSPGLPAVGFTGVEEDTNLRGDFRQQIDWPFATGQVRWVPYVMGRYTGYTDSPDGDMQNRALVGAGLRTQTSFYKVDDSVRSALFDLNRVRHVVEPYSHLFTSVQSEDRQDLFIYDEGVDAVTDLSAIQVGVRQRWQTKRGGPGRWRSVDFLTLDVSGNFYTNTPDDEELEPIDFRGLYINTMPEASIPRDGIRADAVWRLTDTFAVVADAYHNLEENNLATAAAGVAARAGQRVRYFVGTRYIDELDSNILTGSIYYELSRKYEVGFGQSYNLAEEDNVQTAFQVTRRYDQISVTLQASRDSVEGETTFSVNLYPAGLGSRANLGTGGLTRLERNDGR